MLQMLTELALRRRRAVTVLVLLMVPVLLVAGAGVADRLTTGGLVDPGSESARASALLDKTFDAGPTNFLLLVSARQGRVESPDNARAGRAMTQAIAARDGVDEVISFWGLQDVVPSLANPLRSRDGTEAIIAVRLSGDEDARRDTAEALDAITGASTRFDVRAGGEVEISREATEQAERDLRQAELIVAPLTLVILLLVFRGWRAAVLPLAVAMLAVLGTFVVLTVLTMFTEISTFALNLTTALGLGLAIDYSLLIVARFREELALGRSPAPALHRTMQTAGRTVLYSGATVAASMLALLVFPIAYLRSFAFAGIAVVATACAATVVVAPTLLAIFGERIGRARDTDGGGFWRTQTQRVVARPVPWLFAVVGVLLLLGAPFLGIEPGRIDDRVLPSDASARVVADDIREQFDPRALNTVAVVAPGITADDVELLGAIEQVILGVDGVDRVDSALGTATPAGRLAVVLDAGRFAAPDATWLGVTLTHPPDTDDVERTIVELRNALDRFDQPLLVGGATASTVDSIDAVTGRLPLALAVIAVVTLALLFMMTGSVVVPLKALVLNLFSLTATFGALVWIFQDGNLGDLLGVTATGRIDIFTPVLMFCIAFGLSMDYEVFLLARIKEEYDLGGDNERAVVDGIGHTGRLVTAAAVLLAVVFVAISFSGVTVVKMFGVGLAIAVVTDAFAVRATLIPAVMGLAGRTNWWAPGPLRRFHLRWGLWENDPVLLPDPTTPANAVTHHTAYHTSQDIPTGAPSHDHHDSHASARPEPRRAARSDALAPRLQPPRPADRRAPSGAPLPHARHDVDQIR